jgi:phage tail sheath gpL-like
MGGTQILQPEVTLSLTNADRAVSNTDQKVLIVGQMVAAGSAVDGELQSNLSSSGAPENALFGEASQIAAMVRAFKSINPQVQVDAIGIDDAAGTAGTKIITLVGGPATEAGTLVVVAGSETLHRYEIAVAVDDSITDIGDAIEAAILADTKCPYTASNAVGVVTLTCDNLGTVGNDLGVECTGTVAGLTSHDVTVGVTGATDPTLTSVLDVATERYQGIVWPYSVNTALDTLLLWLDDRFNPTNAVMDGVAFTTLVDSYANSLTSGNGENSPSLVIFSDKLEAETNYQGPSQNEPTYSKSAMFAAIRSLRLTPDASISRYVTSSASLDQFGGPALATLPYFNTPIPQMPTIATGRGWTALEVEALLAAGISVIGVNATGSSALVGEVVTTYKTDTASNPDDTFRFLNYVDTSSGVREYYFNNYKSRFAQSRLTDGTVSRGRDMANDVIIRAYSEQLYKTLSGPNYVLVQSGEAAFVYYKENLDLTLDLGLGKVTIVMFVPIVTQLRQIIATIKIAFNTTEG